jgi:hypothetical protein
MDVTPSPAPGFHLPNFSIDLTWLGEGLLAIVCGIAAIIFIVVLVRRLSSGFGMHPGAIAAWTIGTAAAAVFLTIDSTNRMWPEMRPVTSVGIIGISLVAAVLYVRSKNNG